MNRREFMDALEKLLSDVPLEDRIDALQYYEDYFEDAGAEKEEDIIKELESPEKVAKIIKKDLGILKEDSAKTEYKDYRNSYNNEQQAESDVVRDRRLNKRDRRIIIILLICTLPITIGPILSVLGIVFGFFVSIFAITFGLFVGGAGCFIGSVALFATGTFPVAIMLVGIGLVLIGFALLSLLVCKFMCRIIIPTVIKGIRKIFLYIFGSEEVVA